MDDEFVHFSWIVTIISGAFHLSIFVFPISIIICLLCIMFTDYNMFVPSRSNDDKYTYLIITFTLLKISEIRRHF